MHLSGRFIAIGAVMVMAVACKKGSAPSSTEATSASAAPSTAKAPPNAALVERAKAHAAGCTVNVETGQAYSCAAGIAEATNKLVMDTKPADLASTMAELARSKDDPKVGAAAVDILVSQLDYLGDDGKRKNATPAAVEAVLAAFKESTGARATRLAKPAAQLATIGKSLDTLVAAVEAHPTKLARDEAYRHMMTFARLDAFPTIKAAGSKKEHADAALDAVRNMYKPTDAEKATVCPWAQGFLGDANAEVAASSGYDMVYCRGTYIDALLTEANKRLDAGQFKNPFAAVMREPCFQFAGALTPSPADIAQCDRVYAFLEKAANDPKVDDATRGLALWNIYYQRRDEKSLKLMRKYEKSPNKEIAKRAQEAIKSLVETYKLKG